MVHTDSRVVRQLQPAETEEVRSFGEEILGVLLLLALCFDDDFLGCSCGGELLVSGVIILVLFDGEVWWILLLFWLSSLVK